MFAFYEGGMEPLPKARNAQNYLKEPAFGGHQGPDFSTGEAQP